jgi:hypothetical protein
MNSWRIALETVERLETGFRGKRLEGGKDWRGEGEKEGERWWELNVQQNGNEKLEQLQNSRTLRPKTEVAKRLPEFNSVKFLQTCGDSWSARACSWISSSVRNKGENKMTHG